ncbi:SpoIIE family protein phosphatase [Streptomyces tendae]|uniref:SpoIIE family protein phosphatase n=1 Tax=Streptomyces tendae TaxID=1932 RepID=UPI00384F5A86
MGGDWYKARKLPDGRLLVALGDARGHGPAAVTLMAKLRGALAGLAYTERLDPTGVTVTDTGPHVTTERIPDLFEPFRRLGAGRAAWAGSPSACASRERGAWRAPTSFSPVPSRSADRPRGPVARLPDPSRGGEPRPAAPGCTRPRVRSAVASWGPVRRRCRAASPPSRR